MFLFEKVVFSLSKSEEGNFNANTVSNKTQSITNISKKVPILGKRRAVVTSVKYSKLLVKNLKLVVNLILYNVKFHCKVKKNNNQWRPTAESIPIETHGLGSPFDFA